jgi:carbonic anhydrase
MKSLATRKSFTVLVLLLVVATIGSHCRADDSAPESAAKNQSQHWSYNDQTGWMVEYPECVGKKLRQSPIDIVTSSVIFNPRMQLQFVDYDQDVEFEYKNTHHSVSLTPIPSLATPKVRLNWVHNGVPDEYELQEIHFHWGHGTEKGSEHEVNDQRAAAEVSLSSWPDLFS